MNLGRTHHGQVFPSALQPTTIHKRRGSVYLHIRSELEVLSVVRTVSDFQDVLKVPISGSLILPLTAGKLGVLLRRNALF